MSLVAGVDTQSTEVAMFGTSRPGDSAPLFFVDPLENGGYQGPQHFASSRRGPRTHPACGRPPPAACITT